MKRIVLGLALVAFATFARAETYEHEIADGAVTPPKLGVRVRNDTSATLSAGALVYVCGWNEDVRLPKVCKADADASGKAAKYILRAALLDAQQGTAYSTHRLKAVNTNGASVGDPVYLSATAGGWTLTAPTAADAVTQAVGRVAVVSSSVGEVVIDLRSNNLVRVGTNEIQAGSIARSQLTEDALATYRVFNIRNSTYGALITATEAAGTFNWALSTNAITLKGEVTDNETEVSVGYFQVVLPVEYVAAGDVSVSFRSELLKTGSPTNNGSTLDLECYEQADGAVGADIVSTAAATFAALDTFYTKTFALTATDLVAGDLINCKITTSIVDSEAGGGTITFTSDPPKLLLDVKG